MISIIKISFLVTFVICVNNLFSQDIEIQGQLSTWSTINIDKTDEAQLGLRYIPTISYIKDSIAKGKFDTEISLNTFSSGQINCFENIETTGTIKPYRAWVRYSTKQLEIRAGLQKINFGSATMLRPLMWFDKMDPRDPLQLTDGVYGLLGRYYFLNNANIWVWGLYGNENLKGWETFTTKKNKPEYGARIQVPAKIGEIALTYHYREADISEVPLTTTNSAMENRIAIDGKFDLEVGLWFEGALIHTDIEISEMSYQKLVNLGVDYTFGIGNGINAMTEFFVYDLSDKANTFNNNIRFSALSLSYPMGLNNNISVMAYYDWENKDYYRFVNFQHTLDNWSIYLMAFWNPDKFQIYQNIGDNSLFSGKGIQIMAVFNH